MKQKLVDGDECDVVGRHRRRHKYLQRAGVASAIKRRMRRRARREGKPQMPTVVCRPYYCPTVDDFECCGRHCGFDVCCAAPELHWPLSRAQRTLFRMLGEPIPGDGEGWESCG